MVVESIFSSIPANWVNAAVVRFGLSLACSGGGGKLLTVCSKESVYRLSRVLRLPALSARCP